MKRVLIKQLYEKHADFENKEIKVCGWVRTVRDSKSFGFIELNDGSCFKCLQVVFELGKIANYEEIARLNVGSAVVVTGKFLLTPDNKQPFELKAASVEVEGKSCPEYPLQKKRHGVEFLREIAHLRPRTNLFNAVMKVRSVCAYAIHKFFNDNNFVYVHTPIITASDCEGAGEMFKVTTLDLKNVPKTKGGEVDYNDDFFGRNTALTVSGQLNGESYALAFGNIYTFGPTFRSEKSYTGRHAAEFWMIEPEIAFADLTDDMDLAEAMLKFVVKYVLEHCQQEMGFFNEFVDKTLLERLNKVVNAEFKRITYTEAINILLPHSSKFEFPVRWGMDIQTEHERFLTEQVFNGPIFVTDYPKDIKAFYMRLNDDGKTVAAMDMLVPAIGELVGGSQREERLDLLQKRIAELGFKEEDYWWYLDLRKYGGTRHAGFGLGFERLVMYVTGVNNIRDVIPFPRTTGSAEF